MNLKNLFSILQSLTLGLHKFGKGSIIKPKYKIWGKDRIEIGDNVFIAENSFLSVVSNYKNLSYYPSLKIGNGVCIGSSVHISCVGSVTIEDKVLMSDRVYIGDGIHNYENINIPIIDQPMKYIGPVLIKEGSFIGINSVILPGVTIGKNSVVGASTVVTKDVPDYSIVVGVPGKIVKIYDKKKKKWIKSIKA